LPRFNMLTPFRCNGHSHSWSKNHRMPNMKASS